MPWYASHPALGRVPLAGPNYTGSEPLQFSTTFLFTNRPFQQRMAEAFSAITYMPHWSVSVRVSACVRMRACACACAGREGGREAWVCVSVSARARALPMAARGVLSTWLQDKPQHFDSARTSSNSAARAAVTAIILSSSAACFAAIASALMRSSSAAAACICARASA